MDRTQQAFRLFDASISAMDSAAEEFGEFFDQEAEENARATRLLQRKYSAQRMDDDQLPSHSSFMALNF